MKKILLPLFLLLFSGSFCGISDGGSIGQVFVGLMEGSGTVQPLSPTSVRLKWVKPVGYSSFTIYAGTETEELTSRGTTRLSSFTLSNLEANSNYRFAVEGLKEGSTTTDGKNYIVNFKTWADFAGVYSVNTISSTAIQIIWNYEAEDSMTYEVFIEEGEDAPNLQEEPYATIQDTQLNISDLVPSTKYNIIVRAIYPSGDMDNNVKMESTTTDSSIDPMPVVIFDEVVLGRRPSFKVLNIIEGVVVYLLHNEYTNTAGEVTDMGDVLVAGPIASNGVNQMNNSYSEFKPGTHKIKVRVRSSEEDIIKPQLLTFRVKGLLEEDWKIVDTDYALPQGLGKSSSLNSGTGTSVYAWASPYTYRSLEFGKVLASGDYNGDFIDDLAVGIPLATKDKVNDYFSYSKGFVVVFYGVDGLGLRTNVEPSLNPIDPGDPLIIDANYEDDKGYAFQQYWFGYSLDGGQYTLAKDTQQNRIRTGDINGDGISDLIIGAPLTTVYTGVDYAYNSGTVYVYYGSFGTGIDATAGFVLEDNDTCSGGVCQNLLLRDPGRTRTTGNYNDYHYFGANVIHLGDINADGFGDIAISAPQMHANTASGFSGDNKWVGLGEVYVYYGSANGLIVQSGLSPLRITRRGIYSAQCQAGTAPCAGYNLNTTAPDKALTGESASTFDYFGASLAGGLNLMGDSKPELVISASYIDGSASSSSGVGKLYVFYGHEAGVGGIGKGFDNVLKITVPTGFSSGTANNLGRSISLIPDVNNDGYAELVSSVGYNSTILKGSRKEGVIVYHGKLDGVWGEADGLADGVSCIDEFSSTYVNFSYNENACKGTGVNVKCCPLYLDLSACSTDTVNNNEDTTYWSGNMDPVVNITGADFNNDGYGDFALGRPWTDSISGITPAYQNSGSACMFFSNGSHTGLAGSFPYTFYDSALNMTSLNYGASIGAGDFTGDGKDDLAVGIPNADAFGIDLNGKIGLYHSEGNWSSLTSLATSYIQGYYTAPLTSYEEIPLHAGDINGDGYGDVVVRIRYFYNGTRYYGFVILHGSERGLVMDKEAVSQPDEATDPQIVVPYRDINWTASSDMCYNIIPIGDVNGDGYDDIYCNDLHHYYGLVFYGLASGGVDTSSSATTYVNRQVGSVEPQLYYSYTGGTGRGTSYYQAFAFPDLQYQKGLGDFNNDGYGDIAFSNYYYGYLASYFYEYLGNVWIVYGSSKGLQDPSGTAIISTPYKQLTDVYSNGGFCYTDHVAMQSGSDPDRVCNRTTNVCKIQQLAGYDLKINAGVCVPGAEPLKPEGFQIIDGRGQYFGSTLTTMDYNNDGYTDLIVGASYIYETIAGSERANAGRVYKYKGSAGGLQYDGYISFKDAFEWNTSLNYSSATPGANNFFGAIVNNAGDVNGDGADDLLINANGGKSYLGVNFLVYGSPTDNALQIKTNASTFDEKYVLNDNDSCINGTCKILVFYQPMGSSSYCNRVIGVGDVNGVTEPYYDDVLVNCYHASLHNGSASGGTWGTGESFLYTGGPNGLVVKGLNNQPSYSNKPVCIDGVCTPYNFYPKNISVPKLYRQYGAIFPQPSRVLNNDFNNDGFMDFIVPVNYTSKFDGSSMVGGFFIFY